MTVCGHWFTDPEHQRWKYSQQIFAFLHNIENLEKEKKKKNSNIFWKKQIAQLPNKGQLGRQK